MPRTQTVEALASHHANLDTFHALGDCALKASIHFAELNLNAARSVIAEADRHRAPQTQRKNGNTNPMPIALLIPLMEAAWAYSRTLLGIGLAAQQEAGAILRTRHTDLMGQMGTSLQHSMKSSPMGADLTLQGLQTALTIADHAYAHFQQAAAQFGEIAALTVPGTETEPRQTSC